MAAERRQPRIFNIPAGVSFLPAFAKALLEGGIVDGLAIADGPLALASATIYVPTRRAARALASEIARLAPGPSAILPRIVPLGQMENIETGLLLGDSGFDDGLSADLPPAIGDMRRRAYLARLVLAWSRELHGAIISTDPEGRPVTDPDEALLVAPSMLQAWRLAGELAGLIDEMIIEGVPWSALDRVAPDEFDRYWGITLDFLRIAIQLWPEHLAENDLLDNVERQARLVEAEIARLDRDESAGPVIAIGSTGTNRATAQLLSAIARASRGAVVLPGLDETLDIASWLLVGGGDKAHVDAAATHPQAALRRLLPVLGVERDEVTALGAPQGALHARALLMSEAMRPAEATDIWRGLAERLSDSDIEIALADVTLIEAGDEREEALALAIRIREALEHPHETIALATPDRELAQRVRAELARWNIDVDDSGGEALGATQIGSLARLVIACASRQSGSADLLALMSHPLARFGRSPRDVTRLVRLFDIGVFRQATARHDGDLSDMAGSARQLANDPHAHPALRAISDESWGEIESFAEDVTVALVSVRNVASEASLTHWVAAHRACMASVLRTSDEDIDRDRDGLDALLTLFDDLTDAGGVLTEPQDPESYAAFFDVLAQETIVRGPRRSHPRVKILGLLEARLLDADVMLMGGLDETIWPPSARTDPLLNRPMRAMLGLTPPERRIGQTAHDFVQAMGSRRVVISRAGKRNGAPTVPSRFLQRIRAVAGEAGWTQCVTRGERYRALAAAIDRPAESIQIKPPAPKPALELRPQSLSVTRIETLRRDPYSIHAEKILKLLPLEGLDAEEGPRETGTRMHAILAAHSRLHPAGPLPKNVAPELLDMARREFADSLLDPEFCTFQWPRIEASLTAFAHWDDSRREGLASILVEQSGKLAIALADGSAFRLSGIADRIEIGRDGKIVIIDFKTGAPPSQAEIKAGFASQLTLEAAMAARGGFDFIARPEDIAGAAYVRLLSREEIEPREVAKPDDFAQLVVDHFDGLLQLLNQFRDPKTAYLSRPYVKFVHRFSAYDHLARVKEWSSNGGGGGP